MSLIRTSRFMLAASVGNALKTSTTCYMEGETLPLYLENWRRESGINVSDPEGKGMSAAFANKGKSATHDVPGFADGFPAPQWSASHPKVVELAADDIHEDGRIIVVGDVQGCFEEFEKLMKLVELDRTKDKVILVGDIGFNQKKSLDLAIGSIKMIQHARENAWNSESKKGYILTVRGNHEDAILEAMLKPEENKGHFAVDGAGGERMQKDDGEFLRTLPMMVRVPSHMLVVVHAGLEAGVALEDQRHVVNTKLRVLAEEPAQWWGLKQPARWLPVENKRGVPKNVHSTSWAKLWPGPNHAVFGHDARQGLQLWPFATGLDTGASGEKENGALTALVLPKKASSKLPGPCESTVGGRPGEIHSVPYLKRRYYSA